MAAVTDGAGCNEAFERIDAGSFTFAGFARPERFFRVWRGRPLGLMHEAPRIHRLTNVLYMPATRSSKPFEGCLYDAHGRRVETSCIRRTTRDQCMHADARTRPREPDRPPVLEGAVLYLGHVIGHYGHFLLESLSRWWPLLQSEPGYERFLVHVTEPGLLERPHVQVCMKALGVELSRVVHSPRPLQVADVSVPEAAVQLLSHAHREYGRLCRRIAAACCDVVPTDQPLYLSRSRLTRGVRTFEGEERLEARMAAHGVRIVHPQLMPFEEQIAAVNGHRRIIGLMGSAMHTTAFCLSPRRLAYLAPGWVHSNYFLVDRAAGHASLYINACGGGFVRRQRDRLKNRLAGGGAFGERYTLDVEGIVRHLTTGGFLS